MSTMHSIEDVAQRLNVSIATIRRLIEAGEIKATRIGKQWRIAEEDLQDYLRRNTNR